MDGLLRILAQDPGGEKAVKVVVSISTTEQKRRGTA